VVTVTFSALHAVVNSSYKFQITPVYGPTDSAKKNEFFSDLLLSRQGEKNNSPM
jgi:hypothetical protein